MAPAHQKLWPSGILCKCVAEASDIPNQSRLCHFDESHDTSKLLICVEASLPNALEKHKYLQEHSGSRDLKSMWKAVITTLG